MSENADSHSCAGTTTVAATSQGNERLKVLDKLVEDVSHLNGVHYMTSAQPYLITQDLCAQRN